MPAPEPDLLLSHMRVVRWYRFNQFATRLFHTGIPEEHLDAFFTECYTLSQKYLVELPVIRA